MLLRDWLVRLRLLAQGRPSRRMQRRPVRRSSASQVQALEARKLLTLTPAGGAFQVNNTAAANQQLFSDVPKSVAVDRDGDFVVTWTSTNQDGSAEGIIVKRYDRNGNPIVKSVNDNGEILVNAFTTGVQRFSSVAIDADGDFVVTWTSAGQDGSGDGVFARRFDKGGNPISPEFRVNQWTTGNQTRSSVAMDSLGNFVVVWESDNNTDPAGVNIDSGAAVWAQFYRADGRAVGTQFKVNSLTTGNQRLSDVALNDEGDFVVTWSDQSNEPSGGYSIFAQRYSFNAAANGGAGLVTADPSGNFKVNQFTTGNQIASSVAIDGDGDFVITWQSPAQEGTGSANGIFARQYDNTGAAVGNEFQVNSFTTGEQVFARVAMRNDGQFIVTWDSANQEAPGSGYGVYFQRYNASGVAIGGETLVNTFTTTHQRFSSVGMNYDGDVVVAWTSLNQDGGGYGVYAQRYLESVETNAPLFSNFVFQNDPLTASEVLQAPVDSLGVVFTEAMLTGAGANSVTNGANLFVERFNTTTMAYEDINNPLSAYFNPVTITFGINATSQKQQALLTFQSLLIAGDYRITLRSNVVDTDTTPHALGGANRVSQFTVRTTHAVGTEAQINTGATANTQTNFVQNPQSIAMDSTGNYIVTWSSRNQDGSGYGVYFRKYSRTGAALTAVTRANATTSGDQAYSSVATFADGSFIITWTGETLQGDRVYYRRYNSAGTAVTGETQVGNTTTFGLYPSVATELDGDYIITYSAQNSDGSGYGVFFQRYNSANVALAPPGSPNVPVVLPARANTFITGNQRNSSIAIDEIGGFILTWMSLGQDGSAEGIYAQRFDQFGYASGVEFRVNTFITGDQRHPSVAMDKNGDFVITWSGANQDGSGYGVYYQRYDRGANALGGNMQANLFTLGNQHVSRVSMDDDGDFVITWVSDGQDGDGEGVFARRFDNRGNPYEPEFQVSTTTTGTQSMPGVAMNRDGDFVVSWASSDGSSTGIFAQNFNFGNPPTAINLSANVSYANVNGGTFVGTFTTVDPDVNDTFTYSLVNDPLLGAQDNALFTINGDGLFTAGPAPSFPGPGNYTIRVRSTDSGGFFFEQSFVINVPNDNTLPQIQLINQVNFLPELTDVTNNVLVADIQITDPFITGNNQLTLGGADADKFLIIGQQLFLKAGTPLDFEVQKQMFVTVFVDDPDVGGAPDDSDSMVINVTRLPQTSPTIGNFGGTVAYNETTTGNITFVQVDPDATVTDPDSANFNTGTLTVDIIANNDVNDRITIRNQGTLAGQVSVNTITQTVGYRFMAGGAPVIIGTYVGGDGLNPLVITFNMQATAEAVQAVLRNILYSNVGDNPVTAPRTIRAVLTDGDGGTSNVVTKTITVTNVNDAPQVNNFDPNVTYVAGSPPIRVDVDATVVDEDSPNLNGGVMVLQITVNPNAADRLTIRNEGNLAGQIGVAGNQIRFGGLFIGTFTGGSGSTPLRITFNAASSPAAAQALLQNIQFHTVSASVPTGARTIQVIMTDGDGGTSTARSKQVTISINNLAPVINNFTATVNYPKGSPPVLLGTGTSSITDADSPNFANGTITFSLIANAEATDRLTVRSIGFGLNQIGVVGNEIRFSNMAIATFTGGAGTNPLIISFNANATPAAASALLRAIQFQSIAANPSGLPRTLSVIMTDGDGGTSNVVQKTINVALVKPAVNNFGGNITYTENQAPVTISSTATVTDADSPNYDGGDVTLEIDQNATADDRLTIFHTGNGVNQIGVAGSNVQFGGVVIGTFTGGIGLTPLVVTFNANATLASVTALVRNLRFSNVSENPSNLQRSLKLDVTDDDGNTSTTVTKLVTVIRVNDIPVIGNYATPAVTFDRSAQVPAFVAPAATVTDADMVDFATGRLTFQLVNNNLAADQLSISSQGFGAGQVGVGGTTIIYDTVVVASFSGGNGTSPLVITFNANADAEAVQAVMRQVTFRTANNAPLVSRTLRVTLTDGDGGTSAMQTKTINIVA